MQLYSLHPSHLCPPSTWPIAEYLLIVHNCTLESLNGLAPILGSGLPLTKTYHQTQDIHLHIPAWTSRSILINVSNITNIIFVIIVKTIDWLGNLQQTYSALLNKSLSSLVSTTHMCSVSWWSLLEVELPDKQCLWSIKIKRLLWLLVNSSIEIYNVRYW